MRLSAPFTLTKPIVVSPFVSDVVNIHETKTHLSKIIDEVTTTGKPITIAKAGTPKVMIVPIDETPAVRQMGTLKGKISVPCDFDSAFADDIAQMFGGE